MIDLHLHLLPGVDDGAADMSVTTAMLREAQRQGFTYLVATPHLVEPLTEAFQGQVQAILDVVQEAAEPFGIDVLSGYEVVLTPDLPNRLSRAEPITLAGSMAILVELPHTVWPTYTETTLFNLLSVGYRPLLAHPERYLTFQRDPDFGIRMAEQGIGLQVTTSAINGLFGKPTQKLVDRWLLAGAVQVVASDAHSVGRRMTEIPAALQRLERLVGADELRRLTTDAPQALLTDNVVPRSLIEPSKPAEGLIGTVSNWLKR